MSRPLIALPLLKKFSSQSPALMPVLFLTACAAMASSVSHAQNLYRSVGPDGRVTYSDRAVNSNAKASSDTTGSAESSAPANAQLPYELRQTASRYPVMIYTGKDCLPCDEARSFLQSRGVPYGERTIDTSSDVAALKKLSGQDSLPFATIGNQHLKGFGPDSWTQYLNAAGYPAQSQLPKTYKAATAKPLTAPTVAAEPQKTAERPAVREPAATAPGVSTQNNPAGLRF